MDQAKGVVDKMMKNMLMANITSGGEIGYISHVNNTLTPPLKI